MKFFVVFALVVAGSLVEGRPGLFDVIIPGFSFSAGGGGGGFSSAVGSSIEAVNDAFVDRKTSGAVEIVNQGNKAFKRSADFVSDTLNASLNKTILPFKDAFWANGAQMNTGGGQRQAFQAVFPAQFEQNIMTPPQTGTGELSATLGDGTEGNDFGAGNIVGDPGMDGIFRGSTGPTEALTKRVRTAVDSAQVFVGNRIKCGAGLLKALFNAIQNFLRDVKDGVVSIADINQLIAKLRNTVNSYPGINSGERESSIQVVNKLGDELRLKRNTLTKAQLPVFTAQFISGSMIPVATTTGINPFDANTFASDESSISIGTGAPTFSIDG